MKKILALMVCVLMLFSVAACAGNNGNVDEGNDGTVNEPGNNTEQGGTVNDNMNNPNGMNDTNNNQNNTNGGTATGNDNIQTLVGTAQGYGGDVKVAVEVNGDDIVSVRVVGEKETQGVGTNALEQLPAKIEEADSTDVEVVSGATVTSNAIKEAVDNALKERK